MKKMALKLELIDLEDKREKIQLYTSQFDSLNEKYKRIEKGQKSSLDFFQIREFDSKDKIKNLKNDLQIYNNKISARETQILSIKNELKKSSQRDFILNKNIKKIELRRQKLELDDEKSKKELEKNEKIIFKLQNISNDYTKKQQDIKLDVEEIKSQIELLLDLIKEIQNKEYPLKSDIKNQEKVHKFYLRELERVEGVLQSKLEQNQRNNEELDKYDRIMTLKSDKGTSLKTAFGKTSTDLELKNQIIHQNKEKLKKNHQILENLEKEIFKSEQIILEVNQNFKEKELTQKRNEEELSFLREYLNSFENVVSKNIESYAQFISDNQKAEDILEDESIFNEVLDFQNQINLSKNFLLESKQCL